MTSKVRFIHAADMHIGAPTRGFGALDGQWAEQLINAIPEAYDRLIETAISRKVDFVVLAGDIFDSSHSSYGDYLHFFEGLEKLDRAGIPSYLVTGNHDPYTYWVRDMFRLPPSAHMLGVGVPSFELYERDGQPLCLIGGRGFYNQSWSNDENIADGITRENAVGALGDAHPNADQAPFAIGIIHTGLDIDLNKAPTTEEALLSHDIDYWACGHLHHSIVRPNAGDPRIVFPGCIQGRDVKETGERGCFLVELEQGVSPRLEFIPTASVVFHTLDVDVGECLTLAEVEQLVRKALFRENGYDHCDRMVVRVNLVGTTELHCYLRQPDVIAGARKHVNDACPNFHCDAIVDCTRAKRAEGEALTFEEPDSALIDYVQNTFVQRRIAVPDALARRMGDFRQSAETRACDLLDTQGETAEALASLQGEIEQAQQGIRELGDELEMKFVEVRKATEETYVFKQDDRELCELREGVEKTTESVASLSAEIETLAKGRDEISRIDGLVGQRNEELAQLAESAAELELRAAEGQPINQKLLDMTPQDSRAARDRLEELSDERGRIVRAVDEARERSTASSAAYDALLEIDESEVKESRRFAHRHAQIIASALMPVIFVAAGIPLFIHGRQINSLSFTAFGIALVVLAFFLAAAALVVLFRPNKELELLEARRKDANWVMLQDKKLLDARLAEAAEIDRQINDYLDGSGFEKANGSIRQALSLLDDAQEERSRLAEIQQHSAAIAMHEETARNALDELNASRRQAEGKAGLPEGVSLDDVESGLSEKKARLEALNGQLEQSTARANDLSERLGQARQDNGFSHLKLDYHQIRAQLRVAKHDFITLLLAQRLLEGDKQ